MVDYASQIQTILVENDAVKSSYNYNVQIYNNLSSEAERTAQQITTTTDPAARASLASDYNLLTQKTKALDTTMQRQLKTLFDNSGKLDQLKSKNQSQSIDSTPKTATAPVKSGSGTPARTGVNADAVSAGDFAYGSLGSGTAGGLGNAALLSTTTILPNTQRTKTSQAALVSADQTYTTEMNKLSQHWSAGDTSSPDYLAQKQSAMSSQYQWELARNNLEEVATSERTFTSDLLTENVELPTTTSPIDLDGTLPDLSQTGSESSDSELSIQSNPPKDQRIRLRPKELGSNGLYPFFGDPDSVLYQLNETNGAFFPYTPTITYQHKATYSEMTPTHANTSYHNYTNTPAVQIQIEGQFSAQNLAEAKYTLAAMHFFRSATKMHFGMEDPDRGLPPPVLVLSGYGRFMFNDLSVILTDFSMALPNNVDYLEVDIGGVTAWVPTLTTFSVSCVVQQTPARQRDDFNLTKFASGKLFSESQGWI